VENGQQLDRSSDNLVGQDPDINDTQQKAFAKSRFIDQKPGIQGDFPVASVSRFEHCRKCHQSVPAGIGKW
jgi:hypothetical protein